MERHYLHEINLERRTAFCSVCGYTGIYVAPVRTRETPKIYCLQKANLLRASKLKRHSRIRAQRRAEPDWKPRHSLSEIDPERLTAICAVCGPTEIHKTTSKGTIRYDCATKHRRYLREYRRTHYVARTSNPHALSEIDEENRTAVCASCGRVEIDIRIGKRKIIRRCINAKKENDGKAKK
jgi:hypothetical protein